MYALIQNSEIETKLKIFFDFATVEKHVLYALFHTRCAC